VLRRGEHTHVGPDLGQDGLGGDHPHPGDGVQDLNLSGERGHRLLDPLLDGLDVGLQVDDVGEHPLEPECVVAPEPGGEGLAQLGQLGPEPPPGQLRQGLGIGLPLDERSHHGQTGDPHHVRGHHGEIHPGVLQDLVAPVDLPVPLLGEGLAVPGEVPELPDRGRRDELPRSSPWASNWAIHAVSMTSVLRPGTCLMWAALTTSTRSKCLP
jgi:hypothetical protein